MSSPTTLLALAGIMEGIVTQIRNGTPSEFNDLEVVATTVQALLQMLAGGTPSEIVLPNFASAAGTDQAIARFCDNIIPGAPFTPGGLNLATATGVPADGSAPYQVTFSQAFPTACSQVIGGFTRDYNGTDEAALQARVVTNSITPAGFELIVTGGQPGSTCSVDYLPFGS